MTDSAPNGTILVRVAPEILGKMKTGDVEPVVILGVQEQADGTHDMTLVVPHVVAEHRRLQEAARAVIDARQQYVEDRAVEADVDAAIDALEATLDA